MHGALSSLFIFVYIFYWCVRACVCMCVRMHLPRHVWRSESSYLELGLSLHCGTLGLNSGPWTCLAVFNLLGHLACSLSDLMAPFFVSFVQKCRSIVTFGRCEKDYEMGRLMGSRVDSDDDFRELSTSCCQGQHLVLAGQGVETEEC